MLPSALGNLFASRITQRQLNRFSQNSVKRWHMPLKSVWTNAASGVGDDDDVIVGVAVRLFVVRKKYYYENYVQVRLRIRILS